MHARILIQKISALVLPQHSRTGVATAAAIVALLSLLSRLSGLIRVRVFASAFGAGETLDSYYAAFRIPDLLMGILIVGTLSIAALPVITQAWKRTEAEGERLVAALLNYTFAGMGLICLLLIVCAPQVVSWIVPGYTGEQLAMVVGLTRLILAAQVVLAATNVMYTALNARKRFFWAGLAPILYNVGLIAGVLWLYPLYGMYGLGYGVLLGAGLHFLVQLFDFYRAGFRIRPLVWSAPGLVQIVRLYVPRLFTVDLSQIVLLLASLIGSRLAAGSISVFSLGFDIQAMPVGVFAFAVATAAFPYLAEYFGAADEAGFARLVRESVVRVLFYMTPVAVALLLMRAQAVRILYGAGQFGWEDTIATFEVLGVLAFSLAGQSLMPLFSRALLARHKTWTPVAANIVSMILTVMVGYWLAPMHGIVGVAAAYVIGVTFNAGLLYVLLRSSLAETTVGEQVLHQEEAVLAGLVSRIIIASACFGVALYGGLYAGALIVNTHTWLGLVLQSLIASVCGGLVYLLVSAVSGLPDAKYLLGKLLPKK